MANERARKDALSVQLRRESVELSYAKGKRAGDIAKDLKVSVSTVRDDLKAIAADRRDRVHRLDPTQMFADQIAALEGYERMALSDAEDCRTSAQIRNNHRLTALRARFKIIEVLQDAGVIPRVTAREQERQLRDEITKIDGIDIDSLSDEQLEELERRLAMEAIGDDLPDNVKKLPLPASNA